MAGLKEIRSRIRSVTNTKKITYAMKLVSATKLRRAQHAVLSSRSYASALDQLLANVLVAADGMELSHPLMTATAEAKVIRLYVIGANRGLCGGYNTNIDRGITKFLKQHADKKVELVLIGKKPADFIKKHGLKALKSYEDLSDIPQNWGIDQICHELAQDFTSGLIDEAHILFTEFKSAITTTVKNEVLLPLTASAEKTKQKSLAIFKPSPADIFQSLIPRILMNKFYQACLDAKASEFGCRMTAMDTATKNAGELMESLKLKANKLRQTSITSEILDIVGGAQAAD